MKLSEEQIEDLKLIIAAAREHIRINDPDDLNTMAAIQEIETCIEVHENS